MLKFGLSSLLLFLAACGSSSSSNPGPQVQSGPSFAGDTLLTMADLSGTWQSQCYSMGVTNAPASMVIAFTFSNGQLVEGYSLYVDTANCSGQDYVSFITPVVNFTITGLDATYSGATDIYGSSMGAGAGSGTPNDAAAAAFLNAAQMDCVTNWAAGVTVNLQPTATCTVNGNPVTYTNPSQADFVAGTDPVGMSGGQLYVQASLSVSGSPGSGSSQTTWIGLTKMR